MALSPTAPTTPAPSAPGRWAGPDVVRAVALVGVVLMNFHGYLVLRGGDIGTGWFDLLLDPFDGPFATRFAATFVLVAGVGVTLLLARAGDDAERRRELRWVLVRRGLVLYVGGLLLDLVWPGTILPYYGAMFALAAVVGTWRSRWLAALGLTAAIAGAGLAWWRFERTLDGDDVSWLFAPAGGSVRGVLFDVAVNGTHPLLPWLAFFCAGMVLGRAVLDERWRPWWRPACVIAGTTLFTTALLVNSAATSPRTRFVLSIDPWDRGLPYTASALGTALLAFAAVTWLVDRFPAAPAVDALARAGRTSLSIYVAHALAFNLVVDWLGWVDPGGVGTALAASAAFWVLAIAAAVWWTRRHGTGPLERVYRDLTR